MTQRVVRKREKGKMESCSKDLKMGKGKQADILENRRGG